MTPTQVPAPEQPTMPPSPFAAAPQPQQPPQPTQPPAGSVAWPTNPTPVTPTQVPAPEQPTMPPSPFAAVPAAPQPPAPTAADHFTGSSNPLPSQAAPYSNTGALDQSATGADSASGGKLKLSTSKPVMAGATAAVIAVTVVGGFLMFNGKNKPSAAPLTAETKQNIERKVDLYAIERSLVQYSGTHNGQYPTLAQLNDQQFRKTSLAGMGLDQATDPIGNTSAFAGEAGPGVYHYEALPKGCDNKKTPCTDHKVVATLSDGQQISVPQ